MDIAGLEELRKGVGLGPAAFAKALTVAAGHMVTKPLREIEPHEVAYIYAACADIVDDGKRLEALL